MTLCGPLGGLITWAMLAEFYVFFDAVKRTGLPRRLVAILVLGVFWLPATGLLGFVGWLL